MKFLHTADWHLGQKFLSNDREEEHRLALLHLADLVEAQQADTLIIAGDVFDIGSPPHYARRLYYNFLHRMLNSSCRHVVIIGGNHDSPSMLDAPRELLRTLNVHVVGAATGNIEDEIIELKDATGRLEAVVAAVPFLRDGDLRSSVSGEIGADRIEHIKAAILEHYRQVATACERYRALGIPIIATGHLYAAGAVASDRQDNIYIGNMDNIDARAFPDVFTYVALGHLHRAQSVAGLAHVWYAGSLIPLSFSETRDEKAVLAIVFEGAVLQSVSPLPLPTFRRLKTIQGSMEEVKAALQRFAANTERLLKPWVEVILETDRYLPHADQQLHEFTRDMRLDLLKIRFLNTSTDHLETLRQTIDLGDLHPDEVFAECCRKNAVGEEDFKELQTTFANLQHWWAQQQALSA